MFGVSYTWLLREGETKASDVAIYTCSVAPSATWLVTMLCSETTLNIPYYKSRLFVVLFPEFLADSVMLAVPVVGHGSVVSVRPGSTDSQRLAAVISSIGLSVDRVIAEFPDSSLTWAPGARAFLVRYFVVTSAFTGLFFVIRGTV